MGEKIEEDLATFTYSVLLYIPIHILIYISSCSLPSELEK